MSMITKTIVNMMILFIVPSQYKKFFLGMK
jgi:hypothetical protein